MESLLRGDALRRRDLSPSRPDMAYLDLKAQLRQATTQCRSLYQCMQELEEENDRLVEELWVHQQASPDPGLDLVVAQRDKAADAVAALLRVLDVAPGTPACELWTAAFRSAQPAAGMDCEVARGLRRLQDRQSGLPTPVGRKACGLMRCFRHSSTRDRSWATMEMTSSPSESRSAPGAPPVEQERPVRPTSVPNDQALAESLPLELPRFGRWNEGVPEQTRGGIHDSERSTDQSSRDSDWDPRRSELEARGGLRIVAAPPDYHGQDAGAGLRSLRPRAGCDREPEGRPDVGRDAGGLGASEPCQVAERTGGRGLPSSDGRPDLQLSSPHESTGRGSLVRALSFDGSSPVAQADQRDDHKLDVSSESSDCESWAEHHAPGQGTGSTRESDSAEDARWARYTSAVKDSVNSRPGKHLG